MLGWLYHYQAMSLPFSALHTKVVTVCLRCGLTPESDLCTNSGAVTPDRQLCRFVYYNYNTINIQIGNHSF